MITPHYAAKYINDHGLNSLPGTPLNSAQSEALQNALLQDAQSYLVNGIISICSSIASMGARNYGWAIVKLYYSVFYLSRANLAIEAICIFYIGRKPVEIIAKPGKLPVKRAGTTHKVVLNRFERHFPSHFLLSNEIEGEASFDWLMKQREIANYKSSMMNDPIPPAPLGFLERSSNIRGWLETFLEDDIGSYIFSKEYACLALPLKFLAITIDEFTKKGVNCRHLDRSRTTFIRKLISDSKGPYGILFDIIRDVCP